MCIHAAVSGSFRSLSDRTAARLRRRRRADRKVLSPRSASAAAIRHRESAIQHPESAIGNPQSAIRDPQSAIPIVTPLVEVEHLIKRFTRGGGLLRAGTVATAVDD